MNIKYSDRLFYIIRRPAVYAAALWIGEIFHLHYNAVRKFYEAYTDAMHIQMSCCSPRADTGAAVLIREIGTRVWAASTTDTRDGERSGVHWEPISRSHYTCSAPVDYNFRLAGSPPDGEGRWLQLRGRGYSAHLVPPTRNSPPPPTSDAVSPDNRQPMTKSQWENKIYIYIFSLKIKYISFHVHI